LIWVYFIIAFLLNLPFGYWRAQHPRMSLWWLFHIHAPIPFLISFRLCFGLPWAAWLIVSSIALCIISQRVGGHLHGKKETTD
jgi:hypothetical protein